MSKINPIYVYNKHRSPVSTLCFGELNNQHVIVTCSDDGEIHVWDLINYSTIIKILIYSSKIIGLESYKINRSDENEKDDTIKFKIEQKLTMISKEENVEEINAKSRSALRLICQTKNGHLIFIRVFGNEQIEFAIQKEIKCSDCTFCPFQIFISTTYLFIFYISSESNNCVNLMIMDNEVEIVNENIINISKNYGMISSMKIKMNYENLALLMLGTENGSCLVFTSRLDFKNLTNTQFTHRLIIDQSTFESFKNGFDLKFQQNIFKDTFVSAIELNDPLENCLQLICGSVEDCLALINLQFIDLTSSDLKFNDLESKCSIVSNNQSSDSPKNGISFKKRMVSPELKLVDRVKYFKITNKGINAIVKREDNKFFATCGWDGRIRIFSLKSFNALAVLTFHKQTIENIKFSPYLTELNAYLLAAASQDKLVTLWSIYNC